MAEKKAEFGVVSAGECKDEYILPVFENREEVQRRIGYPPELRKEGIQGKVVLSLIINKEGKVDYAQVKESPNSELTNLVRSGIRHLEIKPGSCNGKPATMMQDFTMRFRVGS